LVFSGLGEASGRFKVTNEVLQSALDNRFLFGFHANGISLSPSFQERLSSRPGLTPFEYFVEDVMGFQERYHVGPFPPNREHFLQSASDLVVEAIGNAITDAGLHPEEIDQWIVSTVSSHELAPGLATSVKKYFVRDQNQSPTFTLAAGCPGFHLGLKKAVESFSHTPRQKHVVVAHAEIMSSFLTREKRIIPHATFGDGAGAVILSRDDASNDGGLMNFVMSQDPSLVDYVGVTNDRDLYIEFEPIKIGAIRNMVEASKKALDDAGIKIDDIDLVVAHQTGNAILRKVAELIGIPFDRFYVDVQKRFGNISGAIVPFSLSLLKKENRLRGGMTILSPSVGVGGEYGAFLYRVPQTNKPGTGTQGIVSSTRDLSGKCALVTGATSSVGVEIAKDLAVRGAKVICQYNSNENTADQLGETLRKCGAQFDLSKADYCDRAQVEGYAAYVCSRIEKVDYLVHTAGISGSINFAVDVPASERELVMQVNYFAPVELTLRLAKILSPGGVVLYLGSVAEDYYFKGSAAYVSSKMALHGFAASFADELVGMNVKSIYYILGLLDGGMTKKLNPKKVSNVLSLIRQPELIDVSTVAKRIVDSLYKGRVMGTADNYERHLLVRRDGYEL
jgi:3-oxoacyl-[acyl-carrier-protein] synthase III